MIHKLPNTAADKECGAVLLTTLLIMAIMATLAVAMLDDVRFAVKRSANMQGYAQADWYALGAEDFAKAHIEGLVKGDLTVLNHGLKNGQPIIFPIEGGMIAMSVRDGSQCLSLGALGDAPGQRQFRQLLTVLGWDTVAASRLTSAAVDWMDEDSQPLPDGAEDYTYLGANPAYRTANAEFLSVMELRALAGMSEEKYQTLRPYMCARPSTENSNLNVNTLSLLQAPLLAAVLGGDAFTETAIELIKNRPPAGYADQSALLASPYLEDADLAGANLTGLAFVPEHIWIEADITFLGAMRTRVLEYAIDNGQVRRIFRRNGDEARRPMLQQTETKS